MEHMINENKIYNAALYCRLSKDDDCRIPISSLYVILTHSSRESICKETKEAELKEGRYTIILSTRGENENEVPKEMVKFLKFIKADVSICMEDFEDGFVAQLQKSMQKIKADAIEEELFMEKMKEWNVEIEN